jgi:putative FmdB family regulatory protein
MPTYEFECRQCGETFTRTETFAEHDRRKTNKCPKCSSRKVEQLISPAFVKTSKKS